MARSIRTSNPVTLFPFLAVLLCTIGALVLMLVVVSAGIRKDAVATAKQKQMAQSEDELPEQTEPPLSLVDAVFESPVSGSPVDDAAASMAELAMRDDRDRKPIDPVFAQEPPPSPIKVAPPRTLAEISDLEEAALKLEAEVAARARRLQSVNVKTHALKRQLRTVKAQQSDLQLQIIRTANQRAKLEESAGELRVENQQIIEWLDESRKLIDEHKDQLVSPMHSIVPYDGQTGTVRRPIIIECAGDVVRFEAEQVEIPIEVLQKFSPEQNPLASGVEALFRYWMVKEQVADPRRRPRKPYALILVRPSGAEAFSTAVFALDQMVGDFGYELVETDFLYEVPETTADAVRECRAAVEAEIRRGPIRTRRVLNPQGPIDITRVARGPAASRGFFSSSDFRNRKAVGTNTVDKTGDGTSDEGSVIEGADRDVGETVAAAAARRESEVKAAADRARQLLSGRGAEAASLLNKETPTRFDEARAAILAEAARVEAELRLSREAAGVSGLSEAFRNEIAARNAAAGQSENPLMGQAGNDRPRLAGNSAEGQPDTETASSVAGGVRPGGEADQRGPSPRRETASGPPRWLSSSGDRPAVGTGKAVGQVARDEGIGSGTGPGTGGGEQRGGEQRGGEQRGGEQRGEASADGSATSRRSGRGALERRPETGDSLQPSSAPFAAVGSPAVSASSSAALERQSSQGLPVGQRHSSSGQEISSLLNANGSAGASSGSTSASSSGGGSAPVVANGPAIPIRPRSDRIPSRKTQRRWGRSHPDASLGLEKVVEVRIESNRIVVGNEFQVTRKPERSEAEIVKLTIQTIEHLANQWGYPPPRFYWVPSVRLVFDAEESRLGKMLEVGVEDAGAALE